MGKDKKYLIETSAVPVALGESTPLHCRRFTNATADGNLWTSVYIRKEFIARWISYYIRMAFVTDHFRDLADAEFHLSQDFGIRDVKTGLHAVALILQTKGRITSSRGMAKELARLAIGELRKFDRRLKSRTQNQCGCQIGGKELRVDFNHLFDDLRAFLEAQDEAQNCKITRFLGIGRPGRASALIADQTVRTQTKSGAKLAECIANGKPITCAKCATIGDAVIALEQPRNCCLVHIDQDFRLLCAATTREHKEIPSERAADADVPKLP